LRIHRGGTAEGRISEQLPYSGHAMKKSQASSLTIGQHLRQFVDSKALRACFVLVAVALGTLVLVSQWDEIRSDLSRLSVWSLVGSCAAASFALVATAGALRAIIADFGSRLSWMAAFRVFVVGQLGKYIPGTVWGILGPGVIAREYGVPRTRSATAFLVTIAMTAGCGSILAAFTLPFASKDVAGKYVLVLAAAPLLLVALHPRFVNAVLAWILRAARRPPLEHTLSWTGITTGMAWLVAAWIAYGAALGALASSFGVGFDDALVIGVGAFALAWIVGFIVVFAPAGAGVREVVLVAALAPVLDTSTGLVVAMVDRVVIIFAELSLAGVALLVARRRRS